MNTEQPDNTDLRERLELLRLICDEHDVADAPPSLRSRLDRDSELRDELTGTQELLHGLREALKPEPLPETLVRRIHVRLTDQGQIRSTTIWRTIRLAGLAAAAALVLALVQPAALPPASNGAASTTGLSPTDAADIVAAYGLLDWGGHLDYSIERVTTELKEVERSIEREPGAQTGLPWSRDDDWDAPSASRDGALRTGESSGGVTAALIEHLSNELHANQPLLENFYEDRV
jgi:hypothetical protein